MDIQCPYNEHPISINKNTTSVIKSIFGKGNILQVYTFQQSAKLDKRTYKRSPYTEATLHKKCLVQIQPSKLLLSTFFWRGSVYCYFYPKYAHTFFICLEETNLHAAVTRNNGITNVWILRTSRFNHLAPNAPYFNVYFHSYFGYK